jgi:hypothetical protein
LWSPILFTLSIIPVFLIGRNLCESYGNASGIVAALLFATLAGSIYWNKTGAFDREAMQTFLSAWFIYFTIKLFRKPTIRGIIKFGVPSGVALGAYIFVWGVGALYLLPMVFGGMVLISINELAKKKLTKKWDIAPLAKIGCGAVCILVVSSIVVASTGGEQTVWASFGSMLLGYVGLGEKGGGPSIAPASEEAPPQNIGEVFSSFYTDKMLTLITALLVTIALIKFAVSRKRHELLLLSCFAVLMLMVWPEKGQIRFGRLFWPVWPALAGAGVVAMICGYRCLKMWAPSMTFSSASERMVSRPITLALCLLIVTSAFAYNAYNISANQTAPPTEWRGEGVDNALLESFRWINSNTPRGSVIVIEWSFGHLCTAVSERATIADGVAGPPRQLSDSDIIAPPPDYVYYTEEGSYVVPQSGIDPKYRPMSINGRRPDSDRMIVTGSDNELKYLIGAYGTYGAKINYLVFINDLTYGFDVFNSTVLMTSNTVKSTSVQTAENVIEASFGDTTVLVNMWDYSASARQGDSMKSIEGVLIYYPDEEKFIGPVINLAPEMKKIIIVSIFNNGTVNAVLGDFAGAPMLFRAFSAPQLLPDFLGVAYTSSNGRVKIVAVDYSLL